MSTSILRLSIATTFLLLAGNLSAAKPVLTIYTYDSFVSEWGPGPQIRKAFEDECDCELKLVGLEDGVALLSRLKFEGDNSQADVVLGIDTNLTAEARNTGLFEVHGLGLTQHALPQSWSDELFLPYDYGYFAFVYNRESLSQPPTSLKQLIEDDHAPAILIQDPRTSTPGLGLLLWIKKVYGDSAGDAWKKLSKRIVTVSKGWSEAYGLFLKGEAPMVLSYTTSPAYHIIAEQDKRFAAAAFSEGHYQQIEVAGMLASSQQKTLAKQFLAFMISERFQRILPTTNWMYPAVLAESELPEGFDGLIKPTTALIFKDTEVAASRKQWVAEWLEALAD